jgi:hypothetical protein
MPHRTAAFILVLTLTTGCSMTHGDPTKPAKNPHPVKRYEVTATSDAPGPWDSIGAYIGYDIVKADDGIAKCVSMDSFLGEQSLTSIGVDIEMTRVDDHTWRGYFYRDALLDEDYYNLGVCHWDVTSVSASTMAQGVRFAWSGGLDELLHDSPETSYFKKSVYGDRSFARYGAPDYSPLRPEYKQNPGDFFPVTLAVKEVTP